MSSICRAFYWENHTWPYRYACIRPFIAEVVFIRHEEIMNPHSSPFPHCFYQFPLCLFFLYLLFGLDNNCRLLDLRKGSSFYQNTGTGRFFTATLLRFSYQAMLESGDWVTSRYPFLNLLLVHAAGIVFSGYTALAHGLQSNGFSRLWASVVLEKKWFVGSRYAALEHQLSFLLSFLSVSRIATSCCPALFVCVYPLCIDRQTTHLSFPCHVLMRSRRLSSSCIAAYFHVKFRTRTSHCTSSLELGVNN
jgi:hypothetical protein